MRTTRKVGCNLFSVLLVLLIMILSPISVVKALEYKSSESVYNSFGVVFKNLYINRIKYNAGDTMMISFDLELSDRTKYHPFVEGVVKIELVREDQKPYTVVDEIYVDKEANFKREGKKHYELEYKLPEKLPPGSYRLNFYAFMSGFNVAGEQSLYGMYSNSIPFTVVSDSNYYIEFDQDNAFINTEKYTFGTFFPEFEPSDDLTVRIPLINHGDSRDVRITKEVFVWNKAKHGVLKRLDRQGLLSGDIKKAFDAAELRRKVETITVPANGQRDVYYNIGKLPVGTYVVRITAEPLNSDSGKSIVIFRLPIVGDLTRIAISTLQEFPIIGGEENKVIVCFSQATRSLIPYKVHIGDNITGEVDNQGLPEQPVVKNKLHVKLTTNNKVLIDKEFDVEAIIDYRCLEIPLTSQELITKATLLTELYNEDDQLQDVLKTVFDYTKFPPEKKVFKVTAKPGKGYLEYSVILKNELGNDLEGKINIVIMNDKNQPVDVETDKPIKGVFTKKTYLPQGKYYIIAVLDDGTRAKSNLAIVMKEEKKTGITGTNSTIPILISLIVLVIILGLLFMTLFKPRKGSAVKVVGKTHKRKH